MAGRPNHAVDVRLVGSVAMVTFFNRSTRFAAFVVEGVAEPQRIRMAGNEVYRAVFTVTSVLTIRLVSPSATTLYPVADPGETPMASKPSGRYSRFPAVNRGVAPEAPVAEPEVFATEEFFVAPEPEVAAPDPVDISEVEGLNVADAIAWAADDPARREALLAWEHAQEKPRKTVLSALEA